MNRRAITFIAGNPTPRGPPARRSIRTSARPTTRESLRSRDIPEPARAWRSWHASIMPDSGTAATVFPSAARGLTDQSGGTRLDLEAVSADETLRALPVHESSQWQFTLGRSLWPCGDGNTRAQL